jgi:hypothetical protein
MLEWPITILVAYGYAIFIGDLQKIWIISNEQSYS